MTQTTFQAFGLAETLLTALARLEITQPTPIQEQAIPAVMKGRDVLGVAQTGTGKTAAFSLPVLHALIEKGGRPNPKAPRVLILTPTRELASQIADSIKSYASGTKFTHQVIFGGVSIRPQIDAMRRGVDIVIATPGRLLDLMNQRAIDLREVRHLILDEADRMLDMGFVRDVMKIVAQVPEGASVAVVLRDHAAFDRGSRQEDSDQSGACRSDPGSHHRREDRAERFSGAAEG